MRRDYYTPRQAADYTGLSEDTIGRAVRSGDLATVGGMQIDGKKSTRIIIHHDELVRWMHGHTATRKANQ